MSNEEAEEYQFAVRRALPGRDVLLVAVGVALTRGSEVLLQRRPNGVWDLPGGHVAPGESLLEAAVRETREEAGLTVLGATLWTVVSGSGAFVPEGGRRVYYVTSIFRADRFEGEATPGPESVEVRWVPASAPPGPLSSSARAVTAALACGRDVPLLTASP